MLENEKSEKITATRPQPKIPSTLAGARGKVTPPGAAKCPFPKFSEIWSFSLNFTKIDGIPPFSLQFIKFH